MITDYRIKISQYITLYGFLFKAIELKNGNIIEGQILSLNTSTVIIRTKEKKIISYSFEREDQRFIEE